MLILIGVVVVCCVCCVGCVVLISDANDALSLFLFDRRTRHVESNTSISAKQCGWGVCVRPVDDCLQPQNRRVWLMKCRRRKHVPAEAMPIAERITQWFPVIPNEGRPDYSKKKKFNQQTLSYPMERGDERQGWLHKTVFKKEEVQSMHVHVYFKVLGYLCCVLDVRVAMDRLGKEEGSSER